MSTVGRRYEKGMDWTTFSLYLTMLGVGWLMVYTVGYGSGYSGDALELLSSTILGKQTLWIGLSLLTFFFTQIIERNFWKTFAYPIYGLGLLLLVLVLFFGSTIKGATSWFNFGGFSFQPAEVAKFGTCVALAAFMNNYNTNLKHTQSQLVAIGIISAPVFLILLQPDAGSALVFLSFFILLYLGGFPGNFFITGAIGLTLLLVGLVYPVFQVFLGIVAIANLVLFINLKNYKWQVTLGYATVFAVTTWLWGNENILWLLAGNGAVFIALSILQWMSRKERIVILMIGAIMAAGSISYVSNYFFNNFLKPHQQERINVWLRPELCDPRGSLYNVLQSKMAIGSGGFAGKGFLQGTMTKLNYVPEQSTDFIFCTIGEEQGFIGSISIIALFMLLIYRITVLAERQRSDFNRFYAYGVAGILFIHMMINIGMTMGLMPIIGIPLPFISYGGSSLLGFTLLLGVLLKMDANRSEI